MCVWVCMCVGVHVCGCACVCVVEDSNTYKVRLIPRPPMDQNEDSICTVSFPGPHSGFRHLQSILQMTKELTWKQGYVCMYVHVCIYMYWIYYLYEEYKTCLLIQ